LVQVEQISSFEYRTAAVLDEEPFSNFMLHRPGTSSSPEGDLTLPLTVYPLAKSGHEALLDTRKYMRRYGLPIEILGKNIEHMRPNDAARLLRSSAELMSRRFENDGPIAMPSEDILKLIEPTGQGFKDIMDYMRWQESVSDQLILGNTLTSKVDDAGRTGDTNIHMTEEDDKVWYNARTIGETLDQYLLRWIGRMNDIDVSGMYIYPAPVGSRARQKADIDSSPDVIDVESESMEVVDDPSPIQE
jgi:hypothetical protein